MCQYYNNYFISVKKRAIKTLHNAFLLQGDEFLCFLCHVAMKIYHLGIRYIDLLSIRQ